MPSRVGLLSVFSLRGGRVYELKCARRCAPSSRSGTRRSSADRKDELFRLEAAALESSCLGPTKSEDVLPILVCEMALSSCECSRSALSQTEAASSSIGDLAPSRLLNLRRGGLVSASSAEIRSKSSLNRLFLDTVFALGNGEMRVSAAASSRSIKLSLLE